MKLVADTSVLIFLAKIDCLKLIKNHNVIISENVFEEVKKKENLEDYFKIKNLIEKKNIIVKSVNIREDFPKSLGEGEKSSISLAILDKADFVLIDEKKARNLAKLHNLKPKGTIGVLTDSYLKKEISKEQYKKFILNLLEKGYRIEQDILIKILKFIDKE